MIVETPGQANICQNQSNAGLNSIVNKALFRFKYDE